jgi:glycerophosphoryl diester phosphodiesterase
MFDREVVMPVEIIAHRGASADAPENTLAAVRLAWAQGADAVEIDVWLTRDREIVAIHDETPSRFTSGANATPIADQALAELKRLDVGSWKSPRFAGETIPTLAEVLATLPSGKRLYVEIKCGAEIVPVLADFVWSHPTASASLVLIGFSLDVLSELKRHLPAIPMLWVIELTPSPDGHGWSPTAVECIPAAKRAGVDGLDVSACRGLDAKFAVEVHAAGMRLVAWTVDDHLEARRLIATGVEGITTNRPGWLRTTIVAQ